MSIDDDAGGGKGGRGEVNPSTGVYEGEKKRWKYGSSLFTLFRRRRRAPRPGQPQPPTGKERREAEREREERQIETDRACTV